MGRVARLADGAERIPRMPILDALIPGDLHERKRLRTRSRARRSRAVVERLEPRHLLAAGWTLIQQFPLPTPTSVERFLAIPGNGWSSIQANTSSGANTTTASGSATSFSPTTITGVLGSTDLLDLYRADSLTQAVTIRLNVATTANTPDAARLWFLNGAGNIVADLAPSAGSLSAVIEPSRQEVPFVAVVHGMDFSSAAPVAYLLTVTPVLNYAAQSIGESGATAPSNSLGTTVSSPPPDVSTPPPPPPAISTAPPPSVAPPPTTIPTSKGTGSNDGSTTPVETGPTSADSSLSSQPSPLLTGSPIVGAFADNPTPLSLAVEGATQVDLSRLTVAIVRLSVESEFSASGAPGGLLSGIVAQSIAGIPFAASRIPGTYPALVIESHASSQPAKIEETENALPELGFSSRGPVEGGLSARARSEPTTLPALASNAAVVIPTLASDEIHRGARSEPETPVNENRSTVRATRWNLIAAGLALNFASLAMLSAWRPGLIETLKRHLRRARLKKLGLGRKSPIKPSPI